MADKVAPDVAAWGMAMRRLREIYVERAADGIAVILADPQKVRVLEAYAAVEAERIALADATDRIRRWLHTDAELDEIYPGVRFTERYRLLDADQRRLLLAYLAEHPPAGLAEL